MKNYGVKVTLVAAILAIASVYLTYIFCFQKKADTIIYDGSIITMEGAGDNPNYVVAVALRGDKIIFVGSQQDAFKYKNAQTKLIDLQGKTMLPGFIDPHIHHALAGSFYYMTNIRADEDWGLSEIKTKPVINHKSFMAELKKAEAALEDPQEWLVAFGYASYFHGKIGRDELEKISSTRPIILLQRSGHEAFLNGKALKEMGFTAENTRDNSMIDFSKGYFVESPVKEILLPKLLNVILSGDRWGKALRKSVEYLHNNGITTVADMLAVDGFNKEQITLFREIIDAPDIPFRTYMVAEPRLAFEQSGRKAAIKYIDEQSRKSGINLKYTKQVKLFVDGAFFAQLMRMKGGYTDGHQGEWITPPEELKEMAATFWQKEYPMHVHVNGDDGLDYILSVYDDLKKNYPNSTSRVTLHHLGYVRPDQIKKIKELGICGSLLPYYMRALGDIYSKHGLGAQKAEHISSAKTFVTQGVTISLHSDFPMAPSNPLFNAWVAVNRVGQISGKVLGPEERISVYQALRAITIDAAYTINLEDEIGSIKTGKKADFTILAENPLLVDPMRLKDIKVVGKIFNGKYYELKPNK